MSDRFSIAIDLFDAVRRGDLNEEALDAAVIGDPDLAELVGEMLDGDRGADRSGFLDRSVPQSVMDLGPMGPDEPVGILFEPTRPPWAPELWGAIGQEVSPGSRVGGYEIDHVLGEGTSGTVYAARGLPPLRRRVALKLLHARASTGSLARFKREQELLNQLHHPGIARIDEAGITEDGRPFTVVELIDGLRITDHVRSTNAGWRETVGLVQQAACAIGNAHRRGVIHRDLKPSNILVDISGDLPVVKLIDFGIARSIEPGSSLGTVDGELVGTLAYMSPEQLRAPASVDLTTDIFALGVLLYELLEGEHPFGGGATPLPELVSRICSDEVPVPVSVPRGHRVEVADVIRKATAKSPADRYETAARLAEDLGALLEGRAVSARPARLHRLARRTVARRPVTTAVAVTGLAVLGGAIASAISSGAEASLAAEEASAQRAQLRQLSLDLVDGVLVELGQLSGAADVRDRLAGMLDVQIGEPGALGWSDPEFVRRRVLVDEALSDAARDRGDHETSLVHRLDALASIEDLSRDAPADLALIEDRIRLVVKVGDSYGELGRADLRLDQYERAHGVLLGLEGRFPEDEFQLRLCFSLERLANILRLSDPARAKELADRRLMLARGLVERRPEQHGAVYNMAWALVISYGVEKTIDPVTSDRVIAAESVWHANEAVRMAPGRWMYQWVRALAYRNLMMDAVLHDPPDTAATVVEEGMRVIKDFAERNPDREIARKLPAAMEAWLHRHHRAVPGAKSSGGT